MLSKRDEKRRDLPDHCKMLWAALEARNWTEWELMMIFGCSRSRVSRLLNANATITASAALDFELALGIDPETLLRKQGEWLLSLVPPLSESDKARMRQRRETVEAKVHGNLRPNLRLNQNERAPTLSRSGIPVTLRTRTSLFYLLAIDLKENLILCVPFYLPFRGSYCSSW
jgi:plasmid maintenance system antidote protein VapI